MADNGPILVTGAAGQLGAVGRTVCLAASQSRTGPGILPEREN
jgi:hypothetical protein